MAASTITGVLVTRHVTIQVSEHRTASFWQFLVVYDAERDCLTLPAQLPERYTNRVMRRSVLPDSAGRACYEVASRVFEQAPRLRLSDLAAQGAWIVRSDCTAQGAFLPGGVPGVAAAFGVRLHEAVLDAVAIWPHSDGDAPLALYHGTTLDAVASILGSSLQPSFGMLGTAVYAGHFWKAVRFAERDQAHRLRPRAAVLRLLAFPRRTVEYPRAGWQCACPTLCAVAPHSTASARPAAWRAMADHEGAWQASGADAAHALASTAAAGVAKDGTPKYALRNDEWALRPHCFWVEAYVHVRSAAAGAQHDPHDRSARLE